MSRLVTSMTPQSVPECTIQNNNIEAPAGGDDVSAVQTLGGDGEMGEEEWESLTRYLH